MPISGVKNYSPFNSFFIYLNYNLNYNAAE
jgi:hypothetical protein